MQVFWQLGWHWIWVVGVLAAIAAPLIFRFRLTYSAVWSLVFITAASFLWVYTRDGAMDVMLGTTLYSATGCTNPTIDLWSSHGMVGAAYFPKWSPVRVNPEKRQTGIWINTSLGTSYPLRQPGPSWVRPLFKQWGFSLAWQTYDHPNSDRTSGWYGVTAPTWFALLILSALPALWTARLFRRRKIRRWAKEGRCANCGFDRRAHQPTDKCPSCGTIPKPPKTPLTPPPAITSGSGTV